MLDLFKNAQLMLEFVANYIVENIILGIIMIYYEC